jgi:uncharacterized damage-inducible protein DinB
MDAAETLERWGKVRAGLVNALDLLSDSQLDFTPRAGLWSLRETVVHIAGTEDGWLRYYTANRWHANQFEARHYLTVASLKALLAEVHAVTQQQFAQNPDALFAQVCSLPWGAQTSLGWAVWHVLEHEIHHRGEVYLMLGLMGMEAPDV